MRALTGLAISFMITACTAHAGTAPHYLIPGRVPLDWQGPDGNTVVLHAAEGLVVVDTGRSPQHAKSILDYAEAQGKPVAAILNTHWHLDHTTGNYDIRQVHPRADVYATTAIEGALVGFLNRNRAQADKQLADPNEREESKAQIRRGRSVIDNPDRLRATRPVDKTTALTVAGRQLDLRVAPFAVTEADLWVYDPQEKLAIVGDLVVDIVPFMDTACTEGWLKALDEVERTPFVTLIPGHGPAMTRADFLAWKTAFRNFVDCGRSTSEKAQCIAGWERDAAKFIPASHRAYVRGAADYYIDTRLRSSAEEQQKYCKTLKAS